MNRESQGVVLGLVGAAVLWASLSGLYLRYVKAGLQPYLITAGIVLIIAALATFWYELRARRQEDDHGHREPRVAWLLVLPLMALILVAPPALGSYAAGRAGTALQPPFGFPPLPKGDPLQLTVVDYAERAVYDHGHSLGDRRVEIRGFVTDGPGHTLYLTRMYFACCAADAQPIKVAMTGRVPSGAQPNAWLDVIGTYAPGQLKDQVNGGPIPFIAVDQANPIQPPRDQYEV